MEAESSDGHVPPTVLLVEDNRDIRVVYSTALEFHGFQVLQAGNGEDAVRIATRERPDIILMDIALPGVDGWTATKRLRDDARTREIPVVPVTAFAIEEARERARSLDCAGFLTKPCAPSRLLDEVRSILNGNSG